MTDPTHPRGSPFLPPTMLSLPVLVPLTHQGVRGGKTSLLGFLKRLPAFKKVGSGRTTEKSLDGLQMFCPCLVLPFGPHFQWFLSVFPLMIAVMMKRKGSSPRNALPCLSRHRFILFRYLWLLISGTVFFNTGTSYCSVVLTHDLVFPTIIHHVFISHASSPIMFSFIFVPLSQLM